LGFKVENQDGYPDGLNDGVANVGTNVSLEVKATYPWAAAVPLDIYLEYVLPFANVNEARSDWRQLMHAVSSDILGADINNLTTSDVVYILNAALWSKAFNKTIVFKSSQTPLIYDTMSVLAYGYGSCTGVSIFFISALRSVGVAARIAGTPAWHQNYADGNHNWLEVWTPEDREWHFIEAAPAGGGETLDNPCDKWFCIPSSFSNGTQVFAARFDQSSTVRYPMAWDLTNKAIPGENRTDSYQYACMKC
jgi:hypothetical protein